MKRNLCLGRSIGLGTLYSLCPDTGNSRMLPLEKSRRRSMPMFKVRPIIKMIVLSVIFVHVPLPSYAQTDINKTLSQGETVYVSIYSNVHAGPKGSSFLLSAMVSMRNTDPKNEITIDTADYYDTEGKKIESYIKSPIKLKPLAATSVNIKENDNRGGPGANFLVKWKSSKLVNQPIIEGVMLGLRSGQGVSFICPGQILVDTK
jgi:hypothetical protein